MIALILVLAVALGVYWYIIKPALAADDAEVLSR